MKNHLNIYNIILSSKYIYWLIDKSEVTCHTFGYITSMESNIDTHCYSYDDWKECGIYDKEYFFKKMLERYKEKVENNVLYQVCKLFKDILKVVMI